MRADAFSLQAWGANAIDAAEAAHDWTRYRAKGVRDLAWLLMSPSILAATRFGALLADPVSAFSVAVPHAIAHAALACALQALDDDQSDFGLTNGAPAERRLGRYAERLLHDWLAQAPYTTLIAAGLVVRDAHRTVGECDALFQTSASGDRQWHHWELAVKFFLYTDDDAASAPGSVPGFVGCDRYVGAGLADRLDWKMHKLVARQLPLSAHPLVQALAPVPWHPAMLVKGRLFYPLSSWGQPLAHGPSDGMRLLPEALSLDHPRGWWTTWDAWRAASARSDLLWTVLPRASWLGPPQPLDMLGGPAMTARLARHFDASAATPSSPFAPPDIPAHVLRTPPTHAEPLQLAAWTGVAPHTLLSRGFIVPDDWPERATAFRHHHHA